MATRLEIFLIVYVLWAFDFRELTILEHSLQTGDQRV